jgi:hypothetical protein
MCFKKKKPKPPVVPPVDPPIEPPVEPPITSYPKMNKAFWLFIPELLVAQGDLDALFKKIRKAGVWGVRFFLLQSWSTYRLVPWKQAGDIRIVIPGDVDAPVTDLSQLNPDYWVRLNTVLTLLKINDLEAVVSLGDNCSMNTHQQFLSYPFLSAIQTTSNEIYPYIVPQSALPLFTTSPDGLYGSAKFPYFHEWIGGAVAALKVSGVKYRVEIQNEFSRKDWPVDDLHPENWYADMFMTCQISGVDNTEFVHSGDWKITTRHPGLYFCHGVVRTFLPDLPGVGWTRIVLSGDGGYNGQNESDLDVMGRKGLSIEDARGIAQIIVDNDMVGYEWMPKHPWRFDDNLANVDDLPMDIPAAMAYIFDRSVT